MNLLMTRESTDYCFTSDLFAVEPGEDKETNPGRFGLQLARWLQKKLAADGYPEAQTVAEDWGWCVECSQGPIRLWVGCGNSDTPEAAQDVELNEDSPIVWRCFVVAEVPLFKRIFSRIDAGPAERQLTEKLHNLLSGESQIRMVDG